MFSEEKLLTEKASRMKEAEERLDKAQWSIAGGGGVEGGWVEIDWRWLSFYLKMEGGDSRREDDWKNNLVLRWIKARWHDLMDFLSIFWGHQKALGSAVKRFQSLGGLSHWGDQPANQRCWDLRTLSVSTWAEMAMLRPEWSFRRQLKPRWRRQRWQIKHTCEPTLYVGVRTSLQTLLRDCFRTEVKLEGKILDVWFLGSLG